MRTASPRCTTATQSQASKPMLAKPMGAKAMRAGGFDLVSSLLAAILVMAACAVSVLFLLWATGTQLIPEPPGTYPETKLTLASSSAVAVEFELPSAAETVSLQQPTLQQIVQQVESVELASIAAGSTKELGLGGSAPGHSGPDGDGPDDRNSPGDDIVPRYQRWHLVFKSPSQAAYAKQLDALKIQLGAFGGGVEGIDYAEDLSSTIRHYRNREPNTEKRLYFSWSTPSPLTRFEHVLLQRAGIDVSDRQIVKFLPVELENQLAQLELEYAQRHGTTSVVGIEKTVFESQPTGQGFQFVVTRQRYRESRYQQAPR